MTSLNNDLPGYNFAIEYGYSLHHYASDRHSASYMKNGITLTIKNVHGETRAELSTEIGIILCSTGEFSFPHKHFNNFEFQIQRLDNIDNEEHG